MKLNKPFWDGFRWHEAGDECPQGMEKAASKQGAVSEQSGAQQPEVAKPAPKPAQQPAPKDEATSK